MTNQTTTTTNDPIATLQADVTDLQAKDQAYTAAKAKSDASQAQAAIDAAATAGAHADLKAAIARVVGDAGALDTDGTTAPAQQAQPATPPATTPGPG